MKHDTMEEVFESYELDPRLWKKVLLPLVALVIAGWGATAAALTTDPARAFPSLLVAAVYAGSIAIGALFFVMLQHLTGAVWSVTARRTAENIMGALPAAALLFVPLAFGLPYLYEWARPEAVAADPLLQGKQVWLNPRFFLIRAGVYFALWSFWAWRLNRNSERPRRAARWSGAGMVMLTVTACLAGFDWLMSLDPHWYSTMFGIYFYAGAGLAGFAALTVALLALRRADVLRYSVHHEHYHDFGKWIFGLTVFWAYIAFCQYLLIWYANIPEETVWYRERTTGAWGAAGLLLVAGHFFVPFLLLLNRAGKRKLWLLGAVALWVLAMHYVDLYWIAMPVFSHSGPQPSWMDAAGLLAASSTVVLAFWMSLRRRALAPTGDPRFEKSLQFENA